MEENSVSLGCAFLGLPYFFGLLFGVLTIMGFWDNSSDMDGVYQLAALYNQDRETANPLTGSAPSLPEEGDGYSWFTTFPKLNVREKTYRDALAYALMLQKQKGNKYKEMRLNNSGNYEEVTADNNAAETLARAYAGDIDDVTRTLTGLWARKGEDYRESDVYKSLSKDEKMVAVVHGLQFLKKAIPNWDTKNLATKNSLMKEYLDQYNPQTQMAAIEEDIYKNGNYDKYSKFLAGSEFAQEREKAANAKYNIAQAEAAKQAKVNQQKAAEEAQRKYAEEKTMINKRQEERRKRVLDRQGR